MGGGYVCGCDIVWAMGWYVMFSVCGSVRLNLPIWKHPKFTIEFHFAYGLLQSTNGCG